MALPTTTDDRFAADVLTSPTPVLEIGRAHV